MAKDFQIIDRFIGYRTKEEPTNQDPRALVSGSQNVLITPQGKISTRNGYSLQSTSSSDRSPIESSFDWHTPRAEERNMRSYDDELEVYLRTVDGDTVNAWKRVLDGWSAVDFVFTRWWDTTETLQLLLFVNGDSNIYEWNGAAASVDSTSGGNQITKKGSTTWAENGFYTTRDKTLVNTRTGNEHTYTGGETTTTLTGVNNTTGIQAGDILVQKVVTNSNKPASGFDNDTIAVLNNQIYVGSNSDNEVYVSADDDFTDFSFSSPRAPSEGALLTLDDTASAFGVFGDLEVVAIFSGRSDIYRTKFEKLEINSVLAETLTVEKLKAGIDQAAQSQDLVVTIGDSIAFITHEPTLRILSSIENIENPQIPVLSDPIKPDFDNADFTNGDMTWKQQRLFITAPNDSTLFILEWQQNENGEIERFWQPPQIIPVRKLAILGEELHGHSNTVPETYTLFDGTDDDGNNFKAVAKFAYNNFDDRVNLKNFKEYFFEGFISANTKLTVVFDYDFQGSTRSQDKEIDGSDEQTTFTLSMGQSSLGIEPMGGSSEDTSQLAKFRAIFDLAPVNFHELQVTLQTDARDYRWELVSQGPAAYLTTALPVSIKK